jgi:lambda family phage portal protein
MSTVLKHMAAGLNMPYELLLKDFTQTNYSSARAALLEAWRYFQGRRRWLIEYWLMPIYEMWMEEAVAAGRVEAEDFYTRRYAYLRSRWIFAGRGYVDPTKEAKGAQIRLDTGISTLEAECAEQGLDYEEVLDQRQRERQAMAERGLLVQAEASALAPAEAPAPPQEEAA